MSAALPAFLAEAVFYLGSVFEAPRVWFGKLFSPRTQAALLWLTAILPYVIFALASGTFSRNAFQVIAALAAVLSFWYVLLPRRTAYDVGFLALAAAPMILRVFPRLYLSPDPHLRLGDVLGHLMWIRLGIAALLIFREWNPGSFGLWPRLREWRIGTLWFLIAVIPLCALAMGIGMLRFAPLQAPWWRVAGIAIGTFFGVLWVLGLSEELFFRGVIERAFLNTLPSPVLAILLSAVIYGISHAAYRGFPNWREIAVTTVLGIACGIAYASSGSIRAPMVTHAFAVSTLRVLFVYT